MSGPGHGGWFLPGYRIVLYRFVNIALMCTRIMLILAVSAVCEMQTGFAETLDKEISQVVILVHPCPYEAINKVEYEQYRALERVACQRWFDAIPSLPPSTFAIQVDFGSEGPSPGKLHKAFIDRLGGGRVCRIPCQVTSPEKPSSIENYYDEIHQQITHQMTAQGLTFDPSTCKTIIWGQSFEGCAAGFGSAIASKLGMKTLTQLPYEMSAPDALFLVKAAFVQNVQVPNSDVQAYVFDLNDGRCAAFFRSCLTPQWLDYRPITLPIDTALFSVFTKYGDLIWPNGAPLTDDQKKNSRYNQWRIIDWPKDTPPPGPNSFTLATVQERFVIAAKLHLPELIAAIQSAVVKPQKK